MLQSVDYTAYLSKDIEDLNWAQKEMAEVTNLSGQNGELADALVGADIFIGVSAPNIVTQQKWLQQ